MGPDEGFGASCACTDSKRRITFYPDFRFPPLPALPGEQHTMNALRVAARRPARTLCQQRLASTISVISHTSSVSALPLSNVEAQWEKLPQEEQVAIYRQLEVLQKKDWKTLTIDEKKAGACINAFVTTNMSLPLHPIHHGQRVLIICVSSAHVLFA